MGNYAARCRTEDGWWEHHAASSRTRIGMTQINMTVSFRLYREATGLSWPASLCRADMASASMQNLPNVLSHVWNCWTHQQNGVRVGGVQRHAVQLRVAQHADVQVRVAQPSRRVLQILQTRTAQRTQRGANRNIREKASSANAVQEPGNT